jgi:hypothetical protein
MARMKRSPRRREITEISVEGYKSLCTRQRIEIRPLTIVAGVNSAGKSSIIQPLLLLKQTVEAPYDPGPLQLDGPNVSVTNIDQVISKGAGADESRSFSVGIKIDDRETVFKFGKEGGSDIRVLAVTGWFAPDQKRPVTLRQGMSSEELLRLLPTLVEFRENLFERLRQEGDLELRVARDRFMLSPSIHVGMEGEHELSFNVFEGAEFLESKLSEIIHLPALRGNPRRTYRATAVEDRYPGTFETYTAGIIAAWQTGGATVKINALKKDLEELGLTWTVEARQLDDTQVELLVGRLPHATREGAKDLVNIADVGFGVSQTLPVVVALLAAKSGQVVYLEQPEIHLHPRAQAAFAQLVRRAILRGVRVIVETHSALFVRAIQTLAARGDISGRDVALHWFTRDAKTGYTTIASSSLDEKGSFGDWPEDFDEVLLDVEAGYLDAVARGVE